MQPPLYKHFQWRLIYFIPQRNGRPFLMQTFGTQRNAATFSRGLQATDYVTAWVDFVRLATFENNDGAATWEDAALEERTAALES